MISIKFPAELYLTYGVNMTILRLNISFKGEIHSLPGVNFFCIDYNSLHPLNLVTARLPYIAKAADSEPRAVGRAMATNPLYPIVPCHRVVGADMSLVGYGGRQDEVAFNAKLNRLAAEKRGAAEDREIVMAFGKLTVYPVERVIDAAAEHRARRIRKKELAVKRKAADRMQPGLF